MNLINRIKSILLTPKTEWTVIEPEETDPKTLTVSYLIPLALISAIATFIGFGLIGQTYFGVHVGSVGFGLRHAIVSLVSTVGGAFLMAWIIDILAPNFGSEKNFKQSFKLVVYSYTPMLVAGILFIIPSLTVLVYLAGLYGLYIMYLGLQPLKKTPDDKKVTYFVVSLVVVLIGTFALSAILTSIFISASMFGH
jgi:hypothetical protein